MTLYPLRDLDATPYPTYRRSLLVIADDTKEDVVEMLVAAEDEIERLRAVVAQRDDALRLIAGNRCRTFTQGNCADGGRTRGARYSADAWCDACIARDALDAGTP